MVIQNAVIYVLSDCRHIIPVISHKQCFIQHAVMNVLSDCKHIIPVNSHIQWFIYTVIFLQFFLGSCTHSDDSIGIFSRRFDNIGKIQQNQT